MSQIIAPGKWDPVLRQLAKSWTKVVGVMLIAIGLLVGYVLTSKLLLVTDREPTMWTVILVGVPSIIPLAIGCIATFPQITPIIYKIIAWKKGNSE